MHNCISTVARNVTAKGANPDNTISQEKLHSFFFADDYENITLLTNLNITLNTTEPILFYPGCGTDILTPLLYLEKLLPHFTKLKFIFVDTEDMLELIKTILDDVGVSFTEQHNTLEFYWKKTFVTLTFQQQNVFLAELPSFDIYFEKTFRIFKDEHPEYEQKIYNKLNSEGILISDSGFQHVPLKTYPVPQQLSSYQEMILGQKL